MSEPSPRKVVRFPEAGPNRKAERPAPAPGPRLDSWKEIAGYLKRGIRTVQRWEREESLPVHRLRHDKAETVFAYAAELDAWWTGREAAPAEAPAGKPASASIAVLPFVDMSRDKDHEYFCEGIAEEIINALSGVNGLRVASRTAAFPCKGAALDFREIRQRLRVGALLEGSVRNFEGRLRVAVQLTSTADGYLLWSDRYDREMKDVFAVQDEIARSVVNAMRVNLDPARSGELRRAPTADVQAYDYYLRGRSFYYKYGRQDVEFALELFSRAIGRDPAYALAHAGLADCWSYLYLYVEHTADRRRQAEAASRKAVQLDLNSAQAHASLGVALSLGSGEEDARAAFETAIRLDPNLFEAHYFYARHAFARGAPERAVQLYERAMELRPEDYQAPLLVAQIYEDLGRPGEARVARQRGVAIALQHLELNPDDARAVYMAANGLVFLGEAERARELAGRALHMRPADSMLLYNVACIFALLGQAEEALDCLARALEYGLRQKDWLLHDSNLDLLRRDPRFQEILRRLG